MAEPSPSRSRAPRQRPDTSRATFGARSARSQLDLSSISARSLGKEVRGGTAARAGDEPQTQGGLYMPHVHTPACRTHQHVAHTRMSHTPACRTHPHVAHTRMLPSRHAARTVLLAAMAVQVIARQRRREGPIWCGGAYVPRAPRTPPRPTQSSCHRLTRAPISLVPPRAMRCVSAWQPPHRYLHRLPPHSACRCR